ncbi:MAG: GNAT family N-acetyltransferase [Clostridia bacterium]|nr:GNAT family N-acetyltransferase [Clostridia bacterium]
MFINHPATYFQGVHPDNVFFVSNDQRVQLGYGYVVQCFQPEMFPERPQLIYMQMDVKPSARSLLSGALLARAEELRSMVPQASARLYTQISAKDTETLRYYEKLGFKNDDSEDVYRILPVPGRAAAPMGMQYVSVPLDTMEQQDAFLARVNMGRIQPMSRDDLTMMRQQPIFMALAFYMKNMPVCECLIAGVPGNVLLVDVHTAPQYRRQGMAYQLLGAAATHLRAQGVDALYTRVFKRSASQMGLMRKLNGEFVRTINVLPGIDL